MDPEKNSHSMNRLSRSLENVDVPGVSKTKSTSVSRSRTVGVVESKDHLQPSHKLTFGSLGKIDDTNKDVILNCTKIALIDYLLKQDQNSESNTMLDTIYEGYSVPSEGGTSAMFSGTSVGRSNSLSRNKDYLVQSKRKLSKSVTKKLGDQVKNFDQSQLNPVRPKSTKPPFGTAVEQFNTGLLRKVQPVVTKNGEKGREKPNIKKEFNRSLGVLPDHQPSGSGEVAGDTPSVTAGIARRLSRKFKRNKYKPEISQIATHQESTITVQPQPEPLSGDKSHAVIDSGPVSLSDISDATHSDVLSNSLPAKYVKGPETSGDTKLSPSLPALKQTGRDRQLSLGNSSIETQIKSKALYLNKVHDWDGTSYGDRRPTVLPDNFFHARGSGVSTNTRGNPASAPILESQSVSLISGGSPPPPLVSTASLSLPPLMDGDSLASSLPLAQRVSPEIFVPPPASSADASSVVETLDDIARWIKEQYPELDGDKIMGMLLDQEGLNFQGIDHFLLNLLPNWSSLARMAVLFLTVRTLLTRGDGDQRYIEGVINGLAGYISTEAPSWIWEIGGSRILSLIYGSTGTQANNSNASSLAGSSTVSETSTDGPRRSRGPLGWIRRWFSH